MAKSIVSGNKDRRTKAELIAALAVADSTILNVSGTLREAQQELMECSARASALGMEVYGLQESNFRLQEHCMRIASTNRNAHESISTLAELLDMATIQNRHLSQGLFEETEKRSQAEVLCKALVATLAQSDIGRAVDTVRVGAEIADVDDGEAVAVFDRFFREAVVQQASGGAETSLSRGGMPRSLEEMFRMVPR